VKGRTAARPYVCLDLGFHSDPKVMAVGNAAAGVFARALSYCGYHKTDGFVPELWARANSTRTERQKLVSAGLWLVLENGYSVSNWTRYQQTRAEVEALQRERSEAGKKGAEARWSDGNGDGKRHSSSHGKRHDQAWQVPCDSDGKEKETLKKTLTSSLTTQEDDFELPTGDELQRLAEKNGLQVPAWALAQTTDEDKDIPF
jgi:hypothetical protein